MLIPPIPGEMQTRPQRVAEMEPSNQHTRNKLIFLVAVVLKNSEQADVATPCGWDASPWQI